MSTEEGDVGADKTGHRQCGYICHSAKRAKCDCICGGHFHGKAGFANRQAALEALGAEAFIAGLRSEEALESMMDELSQLDD